MTQILQINKFYPPWIGGRGALGLLVLRLVFGAAFMLHGWPKIQNATAWMGPEAPVPGALQDKSLRLAWFVDGGNVFINRYELNNLRYSTGLSFAWSSPFGPLRLSFAQPLNAKTTDHVQRLQFTFGTTF